MKKRKTKQGFYILRRARKSDKTFSYRESIRLAYFELEKRKAYIIKRRGTNNVIYVSQDIEEAKRILLFFNDRKQYKRNHRLKTNR